MQVIGAQFRNDLYYGVVKIDVAVAWNEAEPEFFRDEFRQQLEEFLVHEGDDSFNYKHKPIVKMNGPHISIVASPAYFAGFDINDDTCTTQVSKMFNMAMNLTIASLATPV